MTSTAKARKTRVYRYKPRIRVLRMKECPTGHSYTFTWREPNLSVVERVPKKHKATLVKRVTQEFVSISSAEEWIKLKTMHLRRLYGEATLVPLTKQQLQNIPNE